MGRYSYYFYELDKMWYVFDNKTNYRMESTGSDNEEECRELAESFNSSRVATPDEEELLDQESSKL